MPTAEQTRERRKLAARSYYADPVKREKWKRASLNCKLKKQYGLTIETRQALLDSQGGRCALCESQCSFEVHGFGKGAAHLDHCHATGRVRGVLCGGCNSALGKLGDTVDSIRKVLDYLTINQ